MNEFIEIIQPRIDSLINIFLAPNKAIDVCRNVILVTHASGAVPVFDKHFTDATTDRTSHERD